MTVRSLAAGEEAVSEGSFDEMMAGSRAQDGAAAREVFNRFAGRLIGLARTRLDRLLRAKVSPEDVVQSVFKSFFRCQADGQLDVAGWEELWSLLVVITVRKCGRQLRRFHGAGRDVRREVVSTPAEDSSAAAWQALAREPSAEEAAVLAETLEQLMAGLKERERQVLELRLQGYTIPEISALVGRTEYTVQGILKRIRQRLEPLEKDDDQQ
jgi:RNA polymerase sigma-70 factor (ECF subfamily)